jgi:hypothetical protein
MKGREEGIDLGQRWQGNPASLPRILGIKRPSDLMTLKISRISAGSVAGTAKQPEKLRILPFLDGAFRRIPPIIPPNVLARRISGRLERRPAHQAQGRAEQNRQSDSGAFTGPRIADPHTQRDKSQPKSQQFRAFRQMAASPSNLTCGQLPSHFQFTGAKWPFILVTYAPFWAGKW